MWFGYIVSIDSHGYPQIPLISPLDAQPSFSKNHVSLSSPSIDESVKICEEPNILWYFQVNKLTATVSLVLLEETRVLY